MIKLSFELSAFGQNATSILLKDIETGCNS
jgi:hypothetical protein